MMADERRQASSYLASGEAVALVIAGEALVEGDKAIQYAPQWSEKTWAIGDEVQEGGITYICISSGAQTGTFASNITRWLHAHSVNRSGIDSAAAGLLSSISVKVGMFEFSLSEDSVSATCYIRARVRAEITDEFSGYNLVTFINKVTNSTTPTSISPLGLSPSTTWFNFTGESVSAAYNELILRIFVAGSSPAACWVVTALSDGWNGVTLKVDYVRGS